MTGHLFAIVGPRDAGPGERQSMLDRAATLFADADDVERIDVPGRGATEDAEGALRPGVDRIVPALQSGSLFGGQRAVMVVDAQHLQVAEAKVVAELAASLDPDATLLVLVSAGALPASLSKVVKSNGEVIPIKKMRERDAAGWLVGAARDRGIRLEDGSIDALVRRFGSDIAALGQALDQLAVVGVPVTGEVIAARFRNRPDEPMWHYADAVAAGDVVESLRRLGDFLTHSHPLQLLSFLEGDLKRRSLAGAAGDIDQFAEWVGSTRDNYPVKKAWGLRGRANPADLRRALAAIARADIGIKSNPEGTHRLMMERLTVALCRWYRGRAA